MANKNRAYIALGIGVLSVSTAAIFVKLSAAPASIIALYRLLFSTLILGIPTIIYYREELRLLKNKEWLYSMLSGVFLAIHFITWFESLKYTSVASSVVIVTLQPILAMIGGYFLFKEKVSILGVIGAFFALAGAFIVGWGDFNIAGQALIGDFLAFIGAITATGYWLFGQTLRKKLSLLPYTTVVYSTSTILLLIYNILLGIDLLDYELRDWKLFIALAVIPNIMGHTILNWTIRYINATTVTMSILVEPIGSIILAFLILNETVELLQMIGGLIIIGGIFIYLKYK
ncbi:hypothetical protein BHF71_04490 [Vulcanibacillus modesticaldus]|uniref:EamA domain-containing protein n=1 Tax=Vulcanibacillus modesticaldus TaxID=337097 RepID=A0A1D2YRZ9_9BACI|nr:DMT family transporter [Vulcanibacillus modesticaldus]OEF96415.1 hypothetical protein BHF71_04490 [Vulcanibacillus modesticaldus]